MKKKTPIFKRILFSLVMLSVTEILILTVTLLSQGIIQRLNQNEMDVFNSKVSARKNYLESVMVNDWMALDTAVSSVIDTTEVYLAENGMNVSMLDDSAGLSGNLIANITPQLIEMMRENRVTGAYLIFNTESLPSADEISKKPGVYLRDSDPSSLSSKTNEDILIKISPKVVLEATHIGTASTWDRYFFVAGSDTESFRDILYAPFQTAYESGNKYEWKDMGHWYIPQDSTESKSNILTYTVPLILNDGSVIGVLGVDITFEYLASLLPYVELGFGENGTYLISRYDEQSETFLNAFADGNLQGIDVMPNSGLSIGKDTYVYYETLRLCGNNTPFSSETWVIAGSVQTEYMQEFSRELVIASAVAVVIALLVGVFTSFVISYELQKPISHITSAIDSADPNKNLKISPTGILEIDAMSSAIMRLSHDVIESGKKFSNIIKISSLKMSGFQINSKAGTLFLTEDFFKVFGDEFVDQNGMTTDKFKKCFEKYKKYLVDVESTADGIYMFHIPINGEYRYICLRTNRTDDYYYGLAEDVTQEFLEKQLLQHERDHDALTGLYNRRAYKNKFNDVFALSDSEIKYAALIMIDLDNLKYFNDTYGHEFGDQYIIEAARLIQTAVPDNALCARISGDEFNVLIYGYQTKEELDAKIYDIQVAANSGNIILPDESIQVVHATGGYAYYPEHGRVLGELSKYADYAMYIAKRNHKRSFQEFSRDIFLSQDIQLRNSDALTKMLQYKLVHYAFQPIVDLKTGNVFAYEALMRPDVDSFFGVGDVIETAKREGKLEQIEELTFFMAVASFDENIRSGIIPKNTYLFLNSIPNQRMTAEKRKLFAEKYGMYLPKVVVELTEEEKIDRNIWDAKQNDHRSMGGMIALDDYGSGYNSERMLIDVSPEFIKVDMNIIRNIHTNVDKQAIVANIVGYAHARGKYIIGEGAETEEEVSKLVELGVDYVQGYFFGKPERIPQAASAEALVILHKIHKND